VKEKEVIALKRQIVDQYCQVIIFNTQGKMIDSCDSLFKIPADSNIQKVAPFQGIDITKNNALWVANYFIEIGDFKEEMKYAKVLQLDTASKINTQLRSKLDILAVWLKSDIGRQGENIDSPSFNLLKQYFQHITDSKRLSTDEHVPFKMEHILDAVHLCFGDLLTTRHTTLELHANFSSKFLVGNRLGLLHALLQAIYNVLDVSKFGSIEVQFDFSLKNSRLFIRIKGGQIGEMTEPPTGWMLNGLGLEYHLDCQIVGHEEIASDKLRLTSAEFPYLFNITGGDSSLVEDILHTILDQVKTDLELLEQASENGKWEDLERLTHKLKPNFTSIERGDLAEMLQTMEQYAIKKNQSKFTEILDTFLPVAVKSVEKLKNYQL